MIGGGLAGLSSGVALAEAGFRVRLLEKRPHLGGRAASYVLPGGEHVDNCQHVTLGCCTNLEDFYRRLGVADKIRFFDRLQFAAPDGQRGTMESALPPAPLHMAPSFALFPLLTWADKRAIARALLKIARSGGRPVDLANSAVPALQCSHGCGSIIRPSAPFAVSGKSSWSVRSMKNWIASTPGMASTFFGRRFFRRAEGIASAYRAFPSEICTMVARKPSRSGAGK